MVKNKTRLQILFHFLVSIFTCAIVIIPWLWFININYHNEAIWVFKKFLFAYNETIEQHQGPFFYYFQNIGIVFGEIIWIPIVISIYQIIKRQINWGMIFLNIWWIVPFLIFSFASTKRFTYLLISAPAIFIILSYYWFYIYESKGKIKILKKIVLILLIALPIRYSIERVKPFTNIDRNPKWAIELKQMQNQYDNKTIFFNYEHAIEGMYYTDYIFYTKIPNNNEIDSLERNGYKIMIKKSEN